MQAARAFLQFDLAVNDVPDSTPHAAIEDARQTGVPSFVRVSPSVDGSGGDGMRGTFVGVPARRLRSDAALSNGRDCIRSLAATTSLR